MCIVAFQPDPSDTERLDRAALDRMRASNRDGMGIMWADGERIHTWKDLEDIEGLWNRYTTAFDIGHPVALHFRAISAGDLSVENAHPFIIHGANMAMMHNGTITRVSSLLPDGVSDTRYVRNSILNSLPEDFIWSPGIMTAIDSLIGTDRMLFLHGSGEYAILNKDRGVWIDGTWWSHRGGYRFRNGYTGTTRYVGGSSAGYLSRQDDEDGDEDESSKVYREYCLICDSVGHIAPDCPDKVEGECDLCGGHYDHDLVSPCPVYQTAEGTCVLCSHDAHPSGTMRDDCPRWERFFEGVEWTDDPDEDECSSDEPDPRDPDVCDHCLTMISGTYFLKTVEGRQYTFHTDCDALFCSQCREPIRKTQDRAIINGHSVHAELDDCFVIDSPSEPDEDYLSEQIEGADDDPDDIMFTRYHDSDDPDKPEYFVRSASRATGLDDLETSNHGVYYDTDPVCWPCMDARFHGDDSDTYDRMKAWEIPMPTNTTIKCAGCGEVIEHPRSN